MISATRTCRFLLCRLSIDAVEQFYELFRDRLCSACCVVAGIGLVATVNFVSLTGRNVSVVAGDDNGNLVTFMDCDDYTIVTEMKNVNGTTVWSYHEIKPV